VVCQAGNTVQFFFTGITDIVSAICGGGGVYQEPQHKKAGEPIRLPRFAYYYN